MPKKLTPIPPDELEALLAGDAPAPPITRAQIVRMIEGVGPPKTLRAARYRQALLDAAAGKRRIYARDLMKPPRRRWRWKDR